MANVFVQQEMLSRSQVKVGSNLNQKLESFPWIEVFRSLSMISPSSNLISELEFTVAFEFAPSFFLSSPHLQIEPNWIKPSQKGTKLDFSRIWWQIQTFPTAEQTEY